MGRGQLSIVIIMVLLIAILGGIYIFSNSQEPIEMEYQDASFVYSTVELCMRQITTEHLREDYDQTVLKNQIEDRLQDCVYDAIDPSFVALEPAVATVGRSNTLDVEVFMPTSISTRTSKQYKEQYSIRVPLTNYVTVSLEEGIVQQDTLLQTSDERFVLEIPQNTVMRNVDDSLSAQQIEHNNDFLAGHFMVDFQPSGAAFDPPLPLWIDYSEIPYDQRSSMAPVYFDNGIWRGLSCINNHAQEKFLCMVEHFTFYAIHLECEGPDNTLYLHAGANDIEWGLSFMMPPASYDPQDADSCISEISLYQLVDTNVATGAIKISHTGNDAHPETYNIDHSNFDDCGMPQDQIHEFNTLLHQKNQQDSFCTDDICGFDIEHIFDNDPTASYKVTYKIVAHFEDFSVDGTPSPGDLNVDGFGSFSIHVPECNEEPPEDPGGDDTDPPEEPPPDDGTGSGGTTGTNDFDPATWTVDQPLPLYDDITTGNLFECTPGLQFNTPNGPSTTVMVGKACYPDNKTRQLYATCGTVEGENRFVEVVANRGQPFMDCNFGSLLGDQCHPYYNFFRQAGNYPSGSSKCQTEGLQWQTWEFCAQGYWTPYESTGTACNDPNHLWSAHVAMYNDNGFDIREFPGVGVIGGSSGSGSGSYGGGSGSSGGTGGSSGGVGGDDDSGDEPWEPYGDVTCACQKPINLVSQCSSIAKSFCGFSTGTVNENFLECTSNKYCCFGQSNFTAQLGSNSQVNIIDAEIEQGGACLPTEVFISPENQRCYAEDDQRVIIFADKYYQCQEELWTFVEDVHINQIYDCHGDESQIIDYDDLSPVPLRIQMSAPAESASQSCQPSTLETLPTNLNKIQLTDLPCDEFSPHRKVFYKDQYYVCEDEMWELFEDSSNDCQGSTSYVVQDQNNRRVTISVSAETSSGSQCNPGIITMDPIYYDYQHFLGQDCELDRRIASFNGKRYQCLEYAWSLLDRDHCYGRSQITMQDGSTQEISGGLYGDICLSAHVRSGNPAFCTENDEGRIIYAPQGKMICLNGNWEDTSCFASTSEKGFGLPQEKYVSGHCLPTRVPHFEELPVDCSVLDLGRTIFIGEDEYFCKQSSATEFKWIKS